MYFFAIAAIILNSFIQPYHIFVNAKAPKPAAKLEGKTFKVQSRPFDINGLYLQFQYVVEEDAFAENPKESVKIIHKKLVDLKRHAVVLNFPMLSEDINPTKNLSGIDQKKYSPANFDDVNFDGYKDIREECTPCSGTLGNVEDIYLFNPRAKKFIKWQSIMGVNVEIIEKDKTVQCYIKGAGKGEFAYQEIKFIDRVSSFMKKKLIVNF